MHNPVKQLATTETDNSRHQQTTTDSGTLKSNASKCPGFFGPFGVDQVEEIKCLRSRSVPEFLQLILLVNVSNQNLPKSCFSYQQVGP